MHNFFRQIYRKIIEVLPTKLVLHIENFRGYHKFVDFKSPKYFGEKIQWLKLNGNLEKYNDYVDKYLVRNYVRNSIGDKYLIPLIGVYDNPSMIDYDNLPDKFVIKLNTGSGYNIVVKDKKSLDINKTNKKLLKWLNEDYSKMKKEPQYKNIKKKILIEEYISDSNGELLDYKFFCFNKKIEFLKVDFDRYKNHTVNFYDSKFEKLDIREGNYKNYHGKTKKPDNFDEMVKVVNKLCSKFPFVRVDLYNVDGKIYFGELTFTPAAGINPFKPLERDLEIGNKLKLELKKKNVLYAASTSYKKNRLDGVTIKCRVLEKYLLSRDKINLISVDTDDYKRRCISVTFNILKSIKKCDTIIICSSSPGAYKLLKFLKIIKCNKKIYYFVAGGVLADWIQEGKYKDKYYVNLEKIFVESKEMLEKFNKMGFSNVCQLNNFRYIEKYDNKYVNHKKEFKFVFWARVRKEKGVETSIDLINKLNNDGYNCTLDIIGQIQDAKYLKVIQKKENQYIHYLGEIKPDNRREYEILSQYDILIFPTEYYNEGLPGTIIDACISNLAIIASDWKYAKEYIDDFDKINGVIYQMGDFEDLYKKTISILDFNKLIEMKENSRKKSAEFDINNLLKDFIEEIERG